MKTPSSSCERPGSAGTCLYRPGNWGTLTPKDIEGKKQMPERVFFCSGPTITVLVEELPASGRFCRVLRQGGSMQVPGFSNWSGWWMSLGGFASPPRGS